MRIAMIDMGCVGVVSGTCFGDFGHRVTCMDKDVGKIAALRRGEILSSNRASIGWSQPTPPPAVSNSTPT